MFSAIPQMSSFATVVLSIIIMCVRCLRESKLQGHDWFRCHSRSSHIYRITNTPNFVSVFFVCNFEFIDHKYLTIRACSFQFMDGHGNKRFRVIEGGWFTSPRAMQCQGVCPPRSRSANPISAHPDHASVIMSAALLPPQFPECERASTHRWSIWPAS